MNDGDSPLELFSDELDELCRRWRGRANISFADIVAALHMKAWLLMDEAARSSRRPPDTLPN